MIYKQKPITNKDCKKENKILNKLKLKKSISRGSGPLPFSIATIHI